MTDPEPSPAPRPAEDDSALGTAPETGLSPAPEAAVAPDDVTPDPKPSTSVEPATPQVDVASWPGDWVSTSYRHTSPTVRRGTSATVGKADFPWVAGRAFEPSGLGGLRSG